MNVGLCFNLKKPQDESAPADLYAEWDDEETIEAVRSALARKHEVLLIEGNEGAFEKFRTLRPDIVFNMAEGLKGHSRESHIPAMLEMLGIPYTGSDPLTLAVCLDKALTKEVLSYHQIPTAPFALLPLLDHWPKLPSFPLIVKPLSEGSSKGIGNAALVRTKRDLREQVALILDQYRQPALVEKYLPGREFTVALLGNGPEITLLPIVEIQFAQLPEKINPIYSFEAKWIWDTVEKPLEIFVCPAPVSQKLEKKIRALCRAAYGALRCRDWCRIDLRLDESGEPNILELNPLPGILPNPAANSCFPKAARTAKISYEELINRLLDVACRRVGLMG
ncbi:MAG: ATP-grasp domain-containing protein [Deltaproteobacteria bacterium]|nr:ATP-grasp domain-containing protein [Deltaproteobacteria bacterium]